MPDDVIPRADPSPAHRAAVALLGLAQGLAPASALDVHDALRQGLPAAALRRMVEQVAVLRDHDTFEHVMPISYRTYQRLKDHPARALDAQTSGRLWKFAEVLARASDVFGSQAEAERWLASPAMALDQRRPIDLLATPTGTGLVETLLERLDHGVYT